MPLPTELARCAPIRAPICALGCALALAAISGCGSALDERPCIVLISIDSLRPDHLGCYGYGKPTSPTIDAIAREGVRFETAVSTTSWTLPAHAAMFTGLYDSAHGLFENGLSLAPEHVTLAEALRDAGYQTAGFYGGPYLHPTYGLNQGFDTYQSCMTQIPDDATEAAIRDLAHSASANEHRDITGPRTVTEVTNWAARSDARPFFVFVHLWDVHYDYIPPKEYVELFDPGYTGSLDVSSYMSNAAIDFEHMRAAPRDFQHLLALYDGEIRFTDDNLKRILAVLEQKAGGKDKLMLALVADHGEEFFEHRGKGHQQSLFDEVVKVPMIFRWPGHLTAGRVVREQVRLIDLMPSLCDVGRAKAPSYVQGRDLVPLVERGDPLPTEPALLELLIHPKNGRALRTENFKGFSVERGKNRFAFDLEHDPHETRELDPSDPRVDKCVEAIRRLAESSSALGDRVGAPKRVDVDPKVEAWLRALGYTGTQK